MDHRGKVVLLLLMCVYIYIYLLDVPSCRNLIAGPSIH